MIHQFDIKGCSQAGAWEQEKMIAGNCLDFVPLSYYFMFYDRMAWISSDLVMEEPKENLTNLGREWFCYQDSLKKWHAIYGKYTNDQYKVGLHYISDSNLQNIKKAELINDKDFLLYGKSINMAYKELIKDSIDFNIRYNHYTRKDSINNFSVWIFPAFQDDGKAVYGREFYFKFDPKVEKILDKYIDTGKLRYYMPDTLETIHLDYTNFEAPPLSAIFYAIYYKKYFKSIIIDTRTMIHMMMDGILTSAIYNRKKKN